MRKRERSKFVREDTLTVPSSQNSSFVTETQVLELGVLGLSLETGSSFTSGDVITATIPSDSLGPDQSHFIVRGWLSYEITTDAAAGTTSFIQQGTGNNLLTTTGTEGNSATDAAVSWQFWSHFIKATPDVWACEQSSVMRTNGAAAYSAISTANVGRDFVGNGQFPLVYTIDLSSSDAGTSFARLSGYIEVVSAPNVTYTEW